MSMKNERNFMVTKQRAEEIISNISKRIMNHERFLTKVGYILGLPNRTQDEKMEIMKNSCWVDGTIAGQVRYAQNQRRKLQKSYDVLRKRFVELNLID